MTRLHDQIRQHLETTPGLTQRGLAECMGLNPAAVNRMLYGRRGIMAEEIPVIEAYIGRKLLLTPGEVSGDPKRRRGFSDGAAQAVFATPDMVPVHAHAARRDVPVDWAARHPAQLGIPDAFALYVADDGMAPRYFTGELVYVHPGRPVQAGQDAVAVYKDGRSEIVRVAHSATDTLVIQRFSPQQEKKIARDDIAALFAIVGRG